MYSVDAWPALLDRATTGRAALVLRPLLHLRLPALSLAVRRRRARGRAGAWRSSVLDKVSFTERVSLQPTYNVFITREEPRMVERRPPYSTEVQYPYNNGAV